MSPEAGTKLIGAAVLFAVIGSVVAAISPPDPPPADPQQSESKTASAKQSQQPAAASEQKWVSNYEDYYVTCYVTNGVRWYSAINQTNYNDAHINQTPSDEMWAQVCGRR